jgi:hypothetical protein
MIFDTGRNVLLCMTLRFPFATVIDHEPNIMRVSQIGWMTTKLSLEQQPEAGLNFLGSWF